MAIAKADMGAGRLSAPHAVREAEPAQPGKRNLFMGSGVAHRDVCRCAEMSDQDQLRNRAARLLTLAVQARRKGHRDYAEHFTQRASEILEQPTALERFGTQCCQKRNKGPHSNTDRRRGHALPTLRAGRARSLKRKTG